MLFWIVYLICQSAVFFSSSLQCYRVIQECAQYVKRNADVSPMFYAAVFSRVDVILAF